MFSGRRSLFGRLLLKVHRALSEIVGATRGASARQMVRSPGFRLVGADPLLSA